VFRQRLFKRCFPRSRLHSKIEPSWPNSALQRLEPKLLNAADVTKLLQDQIARWAALIAEAHIKMDDR